MQIMQQVMGLAFKYIYIKCVYIYIYQKVDNLSHYDWQDKKNIPLTRKIRFLKNNLVILKRGNDLYICNTLNHKRYNYK